MRLWQTKILCGLTGAVVLSTTLSGCATAPANPAEHRAVSTEASKVQSLQKQIQERDKMIEERDKRIGELESQLDALRLIEQDRENQRKPPRPPMTLEKLQ